jgi:hypothetical protein
MNTFKNGVESTDIAFEYQAGSVKTTIPWFKPTKHILNKFIKTIPKIENYGKYNLFLVGGVVNGRIGETWDVDIVVCGEIIPYEFEKFLHQIYDIALNKFNILVDVRWFNVSIERHNQLIEINNQEKVKTIRFGRFKKKIGDVCSEINLFEKGKKITEKLVELEILIPTKKALNPKLGNKYVKI